MEQVCEGEKCDFAADLFPSLLEQGVPMYGLMCTGHWCDIGTAEAYYAENMRGGRRNIFSRLGKSHSLTALLSIRALPSVRLRR